MAVVYRIGALQSLTNASRPKPQHMHEDVNDFGMTLFSLTSSGFCSHQTIHIFYVFYDSC